MGSSFEKMEGLRWKQAIDDAMDVQPEEMEQYLRRDRNIQEQRWERMPDEERGEKDIEVNKETQNVPKPLENSVENATEMMPHKPAAVTKLMKKLKVENKALTEENKILEIYIRGRKEDLEASTSWLEAHSCKGEDVNMSKNDTNTIGEEGNHFGIFFKYQIVDRTDLVIDLTSNDSTGTDMDTGADPRTDWDETTGHIHNESSQCVIDFSCSTHSTDNPKCTRSPTRIELIEDYHVDDDSIDKLASVWDTQSRNEISSSQGTICGTDKNEANCDEVQSHGTRTTYRSGKSTGSFQDVLGQGDAQSSTSSTDKAEARLSCVRRGYSRSNPLKRSFELEQQGSGSRAKRECIGISSRIDHDHRTRLISSTLTPHTNWNETTGHIDNESSQCVIDLTSNDGTGTNMDTGADTRTNWNETTGHIHNESSQCVIRSPTHLELIEHYLVAVDDDSFNKPAFSTMRPQLLITKKA